MQYIGETCRPIKEFTSHQVTTTGAQHANPPDNNQVPDRDIQEPRTDHNNLTTGAPDNNHLPEGTPPWEHQEGETKPQ
jgi:hypothetical protein